MDEEILNKIEEVIGQMKCPKGFTCAENGYKSLCKARDIGLESYLECHEDNSGQCKFSVSFGSGYYCQCPLRVYIAKNMK
jgi:hypothetical protein